MRGFVIILGSMMLVSVLAACAPTVRQGLLEDTARYTQCDYVQVDCVDEDCSNVQGGPWQATACGVRYRCTRTAGQVTCVPQGSARSE